MAMPEQWDGLQVCVRSVWVYIGAENPFLPHAHTKGFTQDLLLIIVNGSWFGQSWGGAQDLQMDALGCSVGVLVTSSQKCEYINRTYV